MTPESPQERDLTAAEEARVRGLLAASAEPADLPEDVAERLDARLAELVGDSSPASSRRRRWPTALVAAAAVSVLTLGLAGILDVGGSRESADESLSGAAGGAADSGSSATSESGAEAAAPRPTSDLPMLRSTSLRRDVQKVADTAPPPSSQSQRSTLADCTRPPVRQGERLVAVLLDGESATLVLPPRDGGDDEAEVYSCDDVTRPLVTTTVATR